MSTYEGVKIALAVRVRVRKLRSSQDFPDFCDPDHGGEKRKTGILNLAHPAVQYDLLTVRVMPAVLVVPCLHTFSSSILSF